MSEKRLQLNISSPDDAKSVLQNLAAIKLAYEAHGCTGIHLAIAEEVVTSTAKMLKGVFNWATDYRTIVKPFEDNVLFILPHYSPPAPASTPEQSRPATTVTQQRPVPRSYASSHRRPIPSLSPKPNGKTEALVQPPGAGVS